MAGILYVVPCVSQTATFSGRCSKFCLVRLNHSRRSEIIVDSSIGTHMCYRADGSSPPTLVGKSILLLNRRFTEECLEAKSVVLLRFRVGVACFRVQSEVV